MPQPFRDRHDAGRQLAELLSGYVGRRVVVLGLPRGGVPVAYEVAHSLRAPLDILLLRQLPAPAGTGASLGIVASGGVRLLDVPRIEALQIPLRAVDEITQRERLTLLARERTYRGRQGVLDLRDRTVLLVDDGTAPTATLREGVSAVREHQPAAVVLAVPVLASDARAALLATADDVVVVAAPPPPVAAARCYLDLLPISHTEVRALLSLAQAEAQSRELAAAP